MSIRVECPACGKTIKAPEQYAGRKAKCLGCQNVLRIPEIATALAAQVIAPPTPPPPMPESVVERVREVPRESDRGDSAKEQDLMTVRPSTFRNRPIKHVLTWFLLVVGVVVTLVAFSPAEPPTMAVALAPILAVAILLQWHLATTLRITNRRSILRNGILSKWTREVRHSDVRLLQVDQFISQRMLGVGTVSVASAGHGEVEIRVAGLKNPEHIKETIDGYRP